MIRLNPEISTPVNSGKNLSTTQSKPQTLATRAQLLEQPACDEVSFGNEDKPKKNNTLAWVIGLGAIAIGVAIAIKKHKKIDTKDTEKVIQEAKTSKKSNRGSKTSRTTQPPKNNEKTDIPNETNKDLRTLKIRKKKYNPKPDRQYKQKSNYIEPEVQYTAEEIFQPLSKEEKKVLKKIQKAAMRKQRKANTIGERVENNPLVELKKQLKKEGEKAAASKK